MDRNHDIEHVCKMWSLALPEHPQSWGDGICAGAMISIIKRRLPIKSLIKRRLPGRAWERSRQAPRSVGLWSRVCTLASKTT
jgi:hypothetical protein